MIPAKPLVLRLDQRALVGSRGKVLGVDGREQGQVFDVRDSADAHVRESKLGIVARGLHDDAVVQGESLGFVVGRRVRQHQRVDPTRELAINFSFLRHS